MFPFPWAHRPFNAALDDNPSLNNKSDDLVAEELLTRFPEYGTSTSSLISVLSSNDDQFDDTWMNSDDCDNRDMVDFGSNQSSALLWQQQRKNASDPQFDVASKSNNSWWIPMIAANVPVFGSKSANKIEPDPSNQGASLPETTESKPTAGRDSRQISDKANLIGLSLENNNWDPMEQALWKPKPVTPSLPPFAPVTTLSSSNPLQVKQNSSSITPCRIKSITDNGLQKQDWMPDELYKSCALCDVPFTIFRRKHHCRCCGQIFCNVCSSFYLPQSHDSVHGDGVNSQHAVQVTRNQPNSPTVRVCRTCFDQYNSKQNSRKPHLSSDKATLLPFDNETQVTRRGNISDLTPAASLPPPPPPPLPDVLPQQGSKKINAIVASATTNTGCVDIHQKNLSVVQEGQSHLGRIAADHLELVAKDLLRLHAPLIWSLSMSKTNPIKISSWVNTLLTFATRCCATVNPNVKKGDLLDIRPYVKVKVIPGGSFRDCAYMSGVMFRKTVSHKSMAREVLNPRILLLSGGIDFVRNADSRISSLETLFEQEDKYMELLVHKLLKLEPDVLIIGRSVNRKAHELLVKANIILIQRVNMNLLNRISRQTGATVVSSADHHSMNQLNVEVLGKCCRFRLVTFRDNELWTDCELTQEVNNKVNSDDSNLLREGIGKAASFNSQDVTSPSTEDLSARKQRSIQVLLADRTLNNHERQAALAAQQLGERVLDGTDAVRAGLAKRGVAHTYVMLEGCPKHLGCTVVLRGANRTALKQLKGVFRFLSNFAYNVRLETTYLKERGARLRPDFELRPENVYSSSLCVDYGQPPDGRKIRPWNGGGKNESSLPRGDPGELSAVDHQSILISSVWMTEKTQCCPAEVKGICYYSQQDVALGQFLRDSCFNLSLKCQNPNCKKSVLDHSLSFVHNDGLINIVVEEMDEALHPSGTSREEIKEVQHDSDDDVTDRPIATWTYCQHCRKVVTPLTFISDLTWKFSFGKFLEVFFYNRDAILNAPAHHCSCNLQSCAMLYFGCGKLGARFTYERITPYGVFVRKSLPFDLSFHSKEVMRRLDIIAVQSSALFVKFDKHIEKISREARSLFNSAINRPEHLQTVLSELNKIGSEVDNTTMILHEKIAAVAENCRRLDDASINSALFRFPLLARRYLFNVTTAWNEKLAAVGQAISAMKRIAAASGQDGSITPNVTAIVSDSLNEELSEGMKRLRQLIEHYARYNISDITLVLPSQAENFDVDTLHDGDFDEDFDDPETSLDFADGVDADVIASRRRLNSSKLGQVPSLERPRVQSPKPTKSLGTRRATVDSSKLDQLSTSMTSAPPKPTPAGGVKSAITRFFNRGGRDLDPYVVDLGIFTEGRPRLPPGVDGIFVPVIDDKLSTIIAYSLASTDYAKQFKHFTKEELGVAVDDGPDDRNGDVTHRPEPKAELDDGIVSTDDPVGHSDRRPISHPPTLTSAQSTTASLTSTVSERKATERRMMNRNKSHIKHTFRDIDEKGQVTCKFVCTTYWATQFHAVRQFFLSNSKSTNNTGTGDNIDSSLSSMLQDVEQCYIESLSSAYSWAASGGKSGANFARTADDRFVIKCISRTELQMFLESAPAYFEYLCKAFYHGLPAVLCKIVGVYQIGVHNRENGKRSMEQVAVMQNVFYNRKISKIFDLKGSLRGRFASQMHQGQSLTHQNVKHSSNAVSDDGLNGPASDISNIRSERVGKGTTHTESGIFPSSSSNSIVDEPVDGIESSISNRDSSQKSQILIKSVSIGKSDSHSQSAQSNEHISTLLDGDFLEFTSGRPMPLTDRAKAVFQMSILNDTLFLNYIYVLDYSILVGFDEENNELVVGIIDFMRQYDILKQMERVGKSLPMVVGSEAPTIIQPPLYKARFTNAMERYFMTAPSKWTAI